MSCLYQHLAASLALLVMIVVPVQADQPIQLTDLDTHLTSEQVDQSVKCLEGEYLDLSHGTCVQTCASRTVYFNSDNSQWQCVNDEKCPLGHVKYQSDHARSIDAKYLAKRDYVCVADNSCAKGFALDAQNVCMKVAGPGCQYVADGRCVKSCRGKFSYIGTDGVTCIAECPPRSLKASQSSNRCVKQCAANQHPMGSIGQEYCGQCPSDTEYDKKSSTCKKVCPINNPYKDQGSCTSHCEKYIGPDWTCQDTCDGYIMKDVSGTHCLAKCNGAMRYVSMNGKLRECVESCPYYAASDGRCLTNCPQYNYEAAGVQVCADRCPKGTYVSLKNPRSCISNIPKGYMLASESAQMLVKTCGNGLYPIMDKGKSKVAFCGQCPAHSLYHSSSQSCVSSMSCQGYISENGRECVKTCKKYSHGQRCVSQCPASAPYVNGKTCVAQCIGVNKYLYQGQCVKDCKSLGLVAMLQQGQNTCGRPS